MCKIQSFAQDFTLSYKWLKYGLFVMGLPPLRASCYRVLNTNSEQYEKQCENGIAISTRIARPGYDVVAARVAGQLCQEFKVIYGKAQLTVPVWYMFTLASALSPKTSITIRPNCLCTLALTAVNVAYDKYFKRFAISGTTLNDLSSILVILFFFFVLVANVTINQLFSLIGHAKFAQAPKITAHERQTWAVSECPNDSINKVWACPWLVNN